MLRAAFPLLSGLLILFYGPASAASGLALYQAAGGGSYTSGEILEIAVDIALTPEAQVTALGLEQSLPAGWSFAGAVCGDLPEVTPVAGAQGFLEFAWTDPPQAFPAHFTYAVNVPSGTTGNRQLDGRVLVRQLGLGESEASQTITLAAHNPRAQQLGAYARALGSTALDAVQGIAADASGNLLGTGYFQGNVDFDPHPLTSLVLRSKGGLDAFIQKVDPGGALLWAAALGAAGSDKGHGMALGPAGEVYVTGYYQGAMIFDAATGVPPLPAFGGHDVFICKFSSAGALLWARAFGGSGLDDGLAIAVDATGNAWVTGSFQGTATLPGVGTLAAQAADDIFVLKLDTAGGTLLARAFGGAASDKGLGIAAHGAGGVCLTGNFGGTAEFNLGGASMPLATAGGQDAFVLRLDAAGATQWVRGLHGDGADSGRALAVDALGDICVTGSFQSTALQYSGGGTVLSGSGAAQAFAARFSPLGGLVWARALPGTGNAVAFGAGGEVCLAGGFSGTADFDPGAGEVLEGVAGGEDGFVLQLDPAGHFEWVRILGGTVADSVYALAANAQGNLYAGGGFQGSASFAGHPLASAGGSADGFLLRLCPPEGVAPRCNVITRPTAGPTAAANLDFTVFFTEPVRYFDSAADLVVTATGTATHSGVQILGGSQVYTARVMGIEGGGTVRVSVATSSDVQDLAGNPLSSSSTSSAVQVDHLPPVVTVDAQSVTTGTPLVSGTVTDQSTVAILRVVVGGITFTPSFGAGTWSITLPSALPAGTYDVQVTAIDVFGFTGTDATVNELVITSSSMPNGGASQSAGSTGAESGQAVAVDADGNVYTTGYFQGTVNFGRVPDTPNDVEWRSYGGTDIFVRKTNQAGALLWAVRLGGKSSDRGLGIAVHDSNNVYVTGYFQRTVNFGLSSDNTAGHEVFVCKLDADGTCAWAKKLGAGGVDEGTAVAVDASGNPHVTGFFNGDANLTGGGALTSAGGDDGFLWKLDSSGNTQWAKRFGGTGSDRGLGVAVHTDGTVASVGTFNSTAEFNSGGVSNSLTSAGGQDIFIQKRNSGGSINWLSGMHGAGKDSARAVTVDTAGNLYITGGFQSATLTYSGGGDILTNTAGADIFAAKVNADGTLGWARSFAGSTKNEDAGNAIALDGAGGLYIAGQFSGTVDFLPGPGIAQRTSRGSIDGFLLKLGTNGTLAWVRTFGGTLQDYAFGVAARSNGAVASTGYFQGSAEFPHATLTSNGGTDAFFLHLFP